jgi:hypothetical protein
MTLDNAGVMNPPFEKTEDDLELQSQVVSDIDCLIFRTTNPVINRLGDVEYVFNLPLDPERSSSHV